MKRGTLSTLPILAILAVTLMFSRTSAADEKQNIRHTVPELLALTPADFQSTMNSETGERAIHDEALEKIRQALAKPSEDRLDADTVAAFSAAVMFNVDKKLAQKKLRHAMRKINQQNPDLQGEILTAVYTRYAKEMAPLLWRALPHLKTEREYAIAGFALLLTHPRKAARSSINATMKSHFPDWENDSRLVELHHALYTDPVQELRNRPPLADLLAAPIKPGFPVVFSFQRANRNFMGLAMVRGPDGRFVRNADGSYFNVPQLARSTTNLPSSITNGNTPEGIFTVDGTGTSVDTIWIGPTPYLNAFMPVETSLANFLHQETAGDWHEADYDALVPASWQHYFPFKQAWRAGLAHRFEILAHGTTVNADYYKAMSYYPGTPSAGCLVAMEYWSKTDGKLLHSDQLSLVKAFVSGGTDQGYLVVVNLDNLARPVSLSDVIDAVAAAQAQR